MPEHAWPDATSGSNGGGGGAGSWELAYVRYVTAPDGGVVPSGVTYDPNYEYMIGEVINPSLPAPTNSVLLHILPSNFIQPGATPSPKIAPEGRMFYSPDGGVTEYNIWGEVQAYLHAGGTIGRSTQLTQFGNVYLTATGEFESQYLGGANMYIVIARRQVS